jgi:sterol 3beta-glucosyltransferase
LAPFGNIVKYLCERGVPMLALYSEAVFPRPSDWPELAQVTGFCMLPTPSGYVAPPALERFLEAGATPIYVGFGSMTGRDPEELTRTVMDGVRRAGVRAVMVTGWGGLTAADQGDDILLVDDVPHEWLFPRVRAVVHHGGAGTLAAGLYAGKPTLVAPFFGDQPFWGEMAASLGVGPRPMKKRGLDAKRLASAIEALLSTPSYAEAAARVAEHLAGEDGVAKAADAIVDAIARARDDPWPEVRVA